GLGFPREVRILAIPVSDPITFSTDMTPAVAACVPEAATRAGVAAAAGASIPLLYGVGTPDIFPLSSPPG
ncbi:MAG: hypothetical protein ABSA70_08890, partial [Terriglobia bacterium]